jgi:hypothetical protein
VMGVKKSRRDGVDFCFFVSLDDDGDDGDGIAGTASVWYEKVAANLNTESAVTVVNSSSVDFELE